VPLATLLASSKRASDGQTHFESTEQHNLHGYVVCEGVRIAVELEVDIADSPAETFNGYLGGSDRHNRSSHIAGS
jgi:hypothetical protein